MLPAKLKAEQTNFINTPSKLSCPEYGPWQLICRFRLGLGKHLEQSLRLRRRSRRQYISDCLRCFLRSDGGLSERCVGQCGKDQRGDAHPLAVSQPRTARWLARA